MKVIDASALVHWLADESPTGVRARVALREGPVAAPQLIDLEVAATIRRRHLRGQLSLSKAERALDHLGQLPLTRHPHTPLLRRCWDLRDNVTIYDAAYVALAEALAVPLLTADARLANAPGIRCEVELLT